MASQDENIDLDNGFPLLTIPLQDGGSLEIYAGPDDEDNDNEVRDIMAR